MAISVTTGILNPFNQFKDKLCTGIEAYNQTAYNDTRMIWYTTIYETLQY